MNEQKAANGANFMLSEHKDTWVRNRYEELQKEAAVFASQLEALEQQNARSSALVKALGRAFGFGPGGKLERARFKLNYKREQVAQFEEIYRAM